MAAYFNKSEKYHKSVVLDKNIIERLLANPFRKRKFFPQTMHKTGPLPDLNGPEVDLSVFNSYEEAYHQLLLDLVYLQALSLTLAKGSTDIEKVMITGGFCDNTLFMQLLASYFPEMSFYTSTLKRATAVGAALVLHRHWNDAQTLDHLFDFEKIEPLDLKGLRQYQLT
jgi:sugar (pentulose or hexulose) kinase